MTGSVISQDDENGENMIRIHSPANFREIRMGLIGPGILYRASHPIEDDRGDPVIAQLARQARIATILNLVDTTNEIKRKAVLLPWYRHILNTGGVIALGMNFDGMSRQFCTRLRKGIQFMLNRPGPYLIHCFAGVDRTGFVAIVLEALMGAKLYEIIDDYLKSIIVDDEGLAPHDSPQYKRDSEVVREILNKMNNGMAVTEENLQAAAEHYLSAKVSLTVPELELLKERLAGKVSLENNRNYTGG
jgi:protein tyrosine/serine phosphatase